MQLEIQKYLFDIQTSIDSINEYLGDKRDFNTYKENKLLRRGIENLENGIKKWMDMLIANCLKSLNLDLYFYEKLNYCADCRWKQCGVTFQ